MNSHCHRALWDVYHWPGRSVWSTSAIRRRAWDIRYTNNGITNTALNTSFEDPLNQAYSLLPCSDNSANTLVGDKFWQELQLSIQAARNYHCCHYYLIPRHHWGDLGRSKVSIGWSFYVRWSLTKITILCAGMVFHSTVFLVAFNDLANTATHSYYLSVGLKLPTATQKAA